MTLYLTNGVDLHRLISSCKSCLQYINNGRNIRCHDELPHLLIPGNRTERSAYLINTKRPFDYSGHWICLFKFNRLILLCDGLDYAITRPDVMHNIRKFCRLNDCRLSVMRLRSQQKESSKCGFLSMAYLSKYHSMSLRHFYTMQNVFKRNSIRSNENMLIAFAQTHFAFHI